MRNKKVIAITMLTIVISLIVIYLAHSSFAYDYQITDYTLFYKENQTELKADIIDYLSTIDDYLIPNSSYRYSLILTENYDFLTNFAIDYIINHQEAYSDNIISSTAYTYDDIANQKKIADKYIALDEIYKLTDKYFGISDYYIINHNVNIIDNYISLSDYTDSIFQAQISDITIDKEGDMLLANVIYDNRDAYKYTFKVINNVLKIYNIEVSS